MSFPRYDTKQQVEIGANVARMAPQLEPRPCLKEAVTAVKTTAAKRTQRSIGAKESFAIAAFAGLYEAGSTT